MVSWPNYWAKKFVFEKDDFGARNSEITWPFPFVWNRLWTRPWNGTAERACQMRSQDRPDPHFRYCPKQCPGSSRIRRAGT